LGGRDEFAVVVWGDFLGDWLSAAELALAGVRTGLILSGHTYPADFSGIEGPPFPEIAFSPSSSEIIANRFGFNPQAEPESPYEPDFQVVTPQHRLDFFGNEEEFKFGLDRDVPDHSGNILGLLHELDTLGQEFESWLEHASCYPPLAPHERWRWRLFSARMLPRKFVEPFSELLKRHQIPPYLQIVLQSPLNMFSPFSATNLPGASAACLWRFLRRNSRNGHLRENLRGALSEVISANGEVIPSIPVGVELAGRQVRSLRLSDNREIEFQALLARPGDFFSLLDSDQRELRACKKIAGYFPRSVYHTMFFRIERDAVPEAMARRVIFVLSMKRNLWGVNLLLLSRYKRVPRWDTLAVTLGYPKGDMEPPPPDFIFESLQSLMPFLRSDQMEPDETLAPRRQKFYLKSGGLSLALNLVTPLQNLFLPFAELLPRLGASGLFLASRRFADILKKC
jgi:hypothetical protein